MWEDVLLTYLSRYVELELNRKQKICTQFNENASSVKDFSRKDFK